MADVLARAARQHLRPPTDDPEVPTPWGTVRIPAGAIREAVDEIVDRLDRGVPFATGRTAFRTRLRRLARLAHEAARGDDAAPADQFESAWSGNAEAGALAGRIWPSLSAPALVKRALTSRTALARAADGLLDAREQALVLRKGARRIDDEPWTVAELVLLDEAEARLNGVRRTYGHVVVDEAQDLSAMELRAVARRCPSRSMTVLGDLAQATAPGAQSEWDQVVRLLGSPPTARVEELELGYRVPAPIIEVANRLLPTVAPGVRPARSVRAAGRPPVVVPCPEPLAPEVARRARSLAGEWTSVGVIVPDRHADAVGRALADAGVVYGTAGRPGRGEAVTLLVPPEAKGLEFDAVVVAEPAAFLAGDTGGTGDTSGGRLLYIALTRAVQDLTIVHSAPLPPALAPEKVHVVQKAGQSD
jgi:DNA helicase IV